MVDMAEMMQNWMVIPATGTGQRMQSDRPKQYLQLHDKTLLEHTLDNVLSHHAICGAVLVLNEQDRYWPQLAYQNAKPVFLCSGGSQRHHSVFNGLSHLRKTVAGDPMVLIHDAVRPFVQHHDLDRLLDAAYRDEQGALLAVPLSDTLKLADENQCVKSTHPRDRLWRALTPQAFRLNIILAAIASVIKNNHQITDDTSAMELMGYQPKLVSGSALNIKITHPDDMELAQFMLNYYKSVQADLS